MKGAIIYDSKSGTTEQYAQWLSIPLRMPALESGETDRLQLSKYDTLIIGAPIYNGKLLVQEWLRLHEKCLPGKKLFLFIVSVTPASEAEQRAQLVRDNIPEGLTGEVYWLPGRHPEAVEPVVLSPYDLNPLFDAVSAWAKAVPASGSR